MEFKPFFFLKKKKRQQLINHSAKQSFTTQSTKSDNSRSIYPPEDFSIPTHKSIHSFKYHLRRRTIATLCNPPLYEKIKRQAPTVRGYFVGFSSQVPAGQPYTVKEADLGRAASVQSPKATIRLLRACSETLKIKNFSQQIQGVIGQSSKCFQSALHRKNHTKRCNQIELIFLAHRAVGNTEFKKKV